VFLKFFWKISSGCQWTESCLWTGVFMKKINPYYNNKPGKDAFDREQYDNGASLKSGQGHVTG
jgi:hypothetical protein